jgi:hypothetical protein
MGAGDVPGATTALLPPTTMLQLGGAAKAVCAAPANKPRIAITQYRSFTVDLPKSKLATQRTPHCGAAPIEQLSPH